MKKEPFRSSLEVSCTLALERRQTSMAWALLGMVLALPNRDALSKDDHKWEVTIADRIAKQLGQAVHTNPALTIAYVMKMAEAQAQNFRIPDSAPPSRNPCKACNGLREKDGAPCAACGATGVEKSS